MATLWAEQAEGGKKEEDFLSTSKLEEKGSCYFRDIKCDSLTEQTVLFKGLSGCILATR